MPNSTILGSLFDLGPSEQKKLAVWAKGIVIIGREHEAHLWRYDKFYSLIYYLDHGNRGSEHGWEFDHFPTPKWMGGPDDISNLRPLHWRNNAGLGPLSGLGGSGL